MTNFLAEKIEYMITHDHYQFLVLSQEQKHIKSFLQFFKHSH